jgi:hypothetical protein
MRSLHLTQNVQFSVDSTNNEQTLLSNEINCKTQLSAREAREAGTLQTGTLLQ